MNSAVHAVVAAAGSGTRFGTPKWDAELHGRRLVDYALRPLALCAPAVRSITLLLPAGATTDAVARLPDGVELEVCVGGESRAHSVLLGLEAVRARVAGPVQALVHDVARPCVWREDVERLLREAGASGGLLAVPVTDSLKRATDRQVEHSEDRRNLWRAQTPQLFDLDTLTDCLSRALAAGATVTDEAQAMEHGGHRPRLVLGREDNIKVTWPEDLARAARILQEDPDDAYWTRL